MRVSIQGEVRSSRIVAPFWAEFSAGWMQSTLLETVACPKGQGKWQPGQEFVGRMPFLPQKTRLPDSILRGLTFVGAKSLSGETLRRSGPATTKRKGSERKF